MNYHPPPQGALDTICTVTHLSNDALAPLRHAQRGRDAAHVAVDVLQRVRLQRYYIDPAEHCSQWPAVCGAALAPRDIRSCAVGRTSSAAVLR